MESDEPSPLSVYGRTKLEGERGARRLGRSLTVVVRGDRQELPADDADLEAAREVSVVDDQRGSPTFVGHLAEATKAVLDLPYGTYHLAADGEATWAEFAEAIFDEAASTAGAPHHDCRVPAGRRAPCLSSCAASVAHRPFPTGATASAPLARL